jgi:hypothetical protein
MLKNYTKMNDTNPFEDFYEWDYIKSISISFQVFIIIIGPCLLGSIIWYEKHGAHTTQRTIVNHFNAITCICHIFLLLPTNIGFLLGSNVIKHLMVLFYKMQHLLLMGKSSYESKTLQQYLLRLYL